MKTVVRHLTLSELYDTYGISERCSYAVLHCDVCHTTLSGETYDTEACATNMQRCSLGAKCVCVNDWEKEQEREREQEESDRKYAEWLTRVEVVEKTGTEIFADLLKNDVTLTETRTVYSKELPYDETNIGLERRERVSHR